ncbi:hypothetical protein GTV15_03760 [Streptomyces sp. SID7803]|nr:hypothetical protein [Streptomyces sp. SID7803]
MVDYVRGSGRVKGFRVRGPAEPMSRSRRRRSYGGARPRACAGCRQVRDQAVHGVTRLPPVRTGAAGGVHYWSPSNIGLEVRQGLRRSRRVVR